MTIELIKQLYVCERCFTPEKRIDNAFTDLSRLAVIKTVFRGRTTNISFVNADHKSCVQNGMALRKWDKHSKHMRKSTKAQLNKFKKKFTIEKEVEKFINHIDISLTHNEKQIEFNKKKFERTGHSFYTREIEKAEFIAQRDKKNNERLLKKFKNMGLL